MSVRIGCAVGDGYWNDGNCMKLFSQDCNVFVNENAFKWGSMEGNRGQVNWSMVDKLVDFAEQHGAVVKLHNLFWHQQQPGWLNSLNAQELEQAMKDRINYTAQHFKGREHLIYGIDVVNEAVDDNSGRLRDSLYTQKLGNDWVVNAYKWAREAFGTSIQLIYNDYNMEYGGTKQVAVYSLVKTLKQQGLIDEVGFQMHTVDDGHVNITNLGKFFKSYADMGVKVNISELDIRMQQGTNPSQDVKNKQGEYCSEICNALLACGAARSIITWGITDRYSWLSGDIPLPYDYNYNAKPFRDALHKAVVSHNDMKEVEELTQSQPEELTTVSKSTTAADYLEHREEVDVDEECGDLCVWAFPHEKSVGVAAHTDNECLIL
eukprot:TRINITY_DN4625_c0_g1_i1.p1 TRINITY_DN4625_c0_g1~~TRINITY_DN4625_c0_g1_i1.p1  ORF type:complete len:377 (-),score=107.05 TRINITY_DN4625_c0_g1_i1:70-1200(-)